MSPTVAIHRLSAANENDFARIHCDATGNGWCQCVAWWVPSWDGWGERTPAENLELRQKLLKDSVHDGYFVHLNGELAGWVQAWKRDAFPKLAAQFGVTSDDDAWMIGCVLILPGFRGKGVAREALRLIVDDLRLRGARSIDAFPKRGAADAGELWNGPESTYAHLGFAVVRDDAKRPLLRLTL
jgi:ribosomal protein S18 acetylase RimI-like enzyme